MAIEIHPYLQAPASYGDYDAGVVDAARALADGICRQDTRLRVEHIGSTAVPGCRGKGYIDLLLTYPDGHLDAAKAALETLGFGRQSSRDPFPEERPMRVGTVVHEGRRFPVHVHVVAATAPEAAELLWFRDRLRADETLRANEARGTAAVDEDCLKRLAPETLQTLKERFVKRMSQDRRVRSQNKGR